MHIYQVEYSSALGSVSLACFVASSANCLHSGGEEEVEVGGEVEGRGRGKGKVKVEGKGEGGGR